MGKYANGVHNKAGFVIDRTIYLLDNLTNYWKLQYSTNN